MRVTLLALLLSAFCVCAFAQDEEAVEAAPAPVLTHPIYSTMPGYAVSDNEARIFDMFTFKLGTDHDTTVEGRKLRMTFNAEKEDNIPSVLMLSRNFINATKQAGGTVVFNGLTEQNGMESKLTTKFSRDGNKTIWCDIWFGYGGGEFTINSIEVEEMKQELTASAMLKALEETGSVTLYILFDTGKSTIKPESQTIVAQVVEALQKNTAMKVGIEGHTDNVGKADANQKLSEERAKSVMTALIQAGVDAKRMTATGYGQSKPIADNATEDGRAKNRRVELVKK